MFFEKISEIPKIAARTSCTVFVLPPETTLKSLKTRKVPSFSSALTLEPDPSKKTTVITVEQVREFISCATSRETRDRFFIINPADAMNEAAQNAFLKSIEEPHDFCHFVLFTNSPNSLLPTIRSRVQIFYPRIENSLDLPPAAKPKVLDLAKKLISASPSHLPALAADIAKTKTAPRTLALDATAAAIEILYKSYFRTGNPKFLTKLPEFLRLHEHLSANGHIKLHIVADLC